MRNFVNQLALVVLALVLLALLALAAAAAMAALTVMAVAALPLIIPFGGFVIVHRALRVAQATPGFVGRLVKTGRDHLAWARHVRNSERVRRQEASMWCLLVMVRSVCGPDGRPTGVRRKAEIVLGSRAQSLGRRGDVWVGYHRTEADVRAAAQDRAAQLRRNADNATTDQARHATLAEASVYDV